ncbi:MAG TPA: substrate-binding domain-containing protein [Streptosporangiaceae bacterium]|nr:substrate-binding domain-containing protein [Streptosporangiaceae bacterium]
MSGRRTAASAALLVLVAALAAACSSASGSDSTAGSASASAAASSGTTAPATVAEAQSQLAPYENPDPIISLPTLSARPPAGKTIDFVTCPLASCLEIQQAAQAAAKKLDWTVHVYNGGVTPATFTSAMNDVVQSPGDAVLGIGILPNSAFAAQLAALKAKHVPWISVASPSPIGDDMIANFSSAPEIALSGKVMADWIIADSGGKAHVAYFWDPSLTQHLPAKNAFVAEMSKLCPGCIVSVQSTSFSTGIGTTDPPQIVSYLQRNPSTDYVVIGIGDATAGVPEALAAAGLAGKVKIVTRLADTINFKDIAAGTEAMGVTEETYEIGWRMIDAAARHFAGDSMACCTTPIGTVHVITKADLPSDLSVPYTVPGYQQDFLKAWHLAS